MGLTPPFWPWSQVLGALEHGSERAPAFGALANTGNGAERLAQFIDVRDLAEWVVRLLEDGRYGLFNATTKGVAWSDLLSGADVTWVTDEFLLSEGVGEWMELPLWIADPAFAGMHLTDVSRAFAAGLRTRPVADTLRDTLALAQPVDGVGLTPEREAGLLTAWHGR